MSRWAAAKNFLLHRKAAQAKVEMQMARAPMLELPELLAPEGIEPDADWSDLADNSQPAANAKTHTETTSTTPVVAQTVVAAVPAPPRVLDERPTMESIIEIAKINPKSSNQLGASATSQRSVVNSIAEQDTTQSLSQVEIVVDNGQSARRVEAIRNSSSEPVQAILQEPATEVPPSTVEFARATNADLAKSCVLKSPVPQLLAKDQDSQPAVAPVATEDVPNITLNRQPRSSRRLNVLDPKYVR
jgi:hypothetical protein